MSQPPAYFHLLCTQFLRTSPHLAGQLWQTYGSLYPERVQTLRFALDQMWCHAASVEDVRARLAHLEHLLPPQDLLAVSLRLAPEGPQRRRDVVQFEERLLHYMTGQGNWK